MGVTHRYILNRTYRRVSINDQLLLHITHNKYAMSSENIIITDSDNSHIREEWEQKVLGKKIVDDVELHAEGGDSNAASAVRRTTVW